MDRIEEDAQLLRAFVTRQDEAAFAELTRRHIALVYAAARRQIRDKHLAEDVTQAVFILLARKAHSIAGGGRHLAGWLVTTAQLCARSAARREARLHVRERHFAAERARATEPADDAADQNEVTGQLDEALTSLTSADRTALTLRYLQGKPLRDVAAAMRISEPAATKRVSRATQRVRDFFTRRGIELAPAGVADALIRQSMLAAPAHLATSVAASATASKAGAGAAWAIAEGATSVHRVGVIVASTLALAFGVLLSVVWAQQHAPAQTPAQPATQTLAQAPLPARAPAPPSSAPAPRSGLIRVGYYLSDASATTVALNGQIPGYSMVLYDQMKDPAFDIIPVIERGTENAGDLPAVLRQYFAGKKTVIANDPADLKTLDVLIAGTNVTPDDVVDAMEAATRSGMGLMTRNWFAIRNPGHTDQILRLYGLVEGRYDFENNALECEVIDPQHPILASRTPPRDGIVMMRANGTFGVLAPDSHGLIKIKDASKVAYMHKDVPANYSYYTVYWHQLGEGRVVCCCYATYDTPKHLNESVGPQFLKRSLKWLAKRPVD